MTQNPQPHGSRAMADTALLLCRSLRVRFIDARTAGAGEEAAVLVGVAALDRLTMARRFPPQEAPAEWPGAFTV
jgi:hypothetical protein